MALGTAHKVAIVAASTAAIAGLSTWAYLTHADKKLPPEPPKPGRLMCPGDVGRDPAPAEGVGRGDFIVVALISGDGKFFENTWASVLATTPDNLFVALTGEQIAEGVRPIATDKHGFHLGEQLIVPRNCVFEVFKPVEVDGQILCGPQIVELGTFLQDPDLKPIAAGLTVEVGNRSEIIVASKESFGNAWFERLWTRIVTISKSGQVITATVDDTPEKTDDHGLIRGTVVRYNRDCVIGV